MSKRPECESCELRQRPATHNAAALCGLCTGTSRPKPFCLVEKRDTDYLWTLLRTDSLTEAREHLTRLADEADPAEFAVMHWVPERGYSLAIT